MAASSNKPTNNDELPDWLRAIRGDPKPSEATPEASESVSVEETESVSQPVHTEPEAKKPDVSGFLDVENQADEAEDTAIISEDEGEVGRDLWEQILAEEGLSMEAMEEEEKPADMGDMSVREWMASTSDESAKVQAKADQVPPTKKEPEPEPEPEPANLSEEDDGMAMWEQILAEEGLSMEAMEEEEKPADMGDMSVREWMASTSDESAKVQAKADQVPPTKKETRTRAGTRASQFIRRR